jgi:hypothetical protein
MHYPYNAIFGRGLLNTFEVALHSAYICPKVLALLGVLSVYNSQKDARNIEQGFAPSRKNVHFLREALDDYQHHLRSADVKALSETKSTIEADYETKRVALDPRVPNKTVLLGKDLSLEEDAELLTFLDKNSDIFAWSTFDLVGVSRDIIEHNYMSIP